MRNQETSFRRAFVFRHIRSLFLLVTVTQEMKEAVTTRSKFHIDAPFPFACRFAVSVEMMTSPKIPCSFMSKASRQSHGRR